MFNASKKKKTKCQPQIRWSNRNQWKQHKHKHSAQCFTSFGKQTGESIAIDNGYIGSSRYSYMLDQGRCQSNLMLPLFLSLYLWWFFVLCIECVFRSTTHFMRSSFVVKAHVFWMEFVFCGFYSEQCVPEEEKKEDTMMRPVNRQKSGTTLVNEQAKKQSSCIWIYIGKICQFKKAKVAENKTITWYHGDMRIDWMMSAIYMYAAKTNCVTAVKIVRVREGTFPLNSFWYFITLRQWHCTATVISFSCHHYWQMNRNLHMFNLILSLYSLSRPISMLHPLGLSSPLPPSLYSSRAIFSSSLRLTPFTSSPQSFLFSSLYFSSSSIFFLPLSVWYCRYLPCSM